MEIVEKNFTEVIELIRATRIRVLQNVNAELIDLYWQIGKHISYKIAESGWGKSVVAELANFIAQNEPSARGFSDKNLWRMKQFYETYKNLPKLSALLREISWSHNLAIMSRCKADEEKEFYLKLCIGERFSFRELERQISSSVFERTMLGNQKLSTVLRELPQDITGAFTRQLHFRVFEFA